MALYNQVETIETDAREAAARAAQTIVDPRERTVESRTEMTLRLHAILDGIGNRTADITEPGDAN